MQPLICTSVAGTISTINNGQQSQVRKRQKSNTNWATGTKDSVSTIPILPRRVASCVDHVSDVMKLLEQQRVRLKIKRSLSSLIEGALEFWEQCLIFTIVVYISEKYILKRLEKVSSNLVLAFKKNPSLDIIIRHHLVHVSSSFSLLLFQCKWTRNQLTLYVMEESDGDTP